jgi:hypothetical protein
MPKKNKMSQDKAQIQVQFKKAVFKRDKNRCVICEKKAKDAQNMKVLPLHLETIINQMEARYPGVSGTVISRTLTENGVEWSVGFGGMSQPKKFFTGATIADALFKAEAAHEKNQHRMKKS